MSTTSSLRRDMLAVLNESGWKLVRHSKGHAIYRCPCGKHSTSVSATPSDQKSVKAVRTQLRQCPQTRDLIGPASQSHTKKVVLAPEGGTAWVLEEEARIKAKRERELLPGQADALSHIHGIYDYVADATDTEQETEQSQEATVTLGTGAASAMWGLTQLAEEIVNDAWGDGSVFTVDQLAQNPIFIEFIGERRPTDPMTNRTYAARTLRNLTTTRKIELVTRRRGGETEYRLNGPRPQSKAPEPTPQPTISEWVDDVPESGSSKPKEEPEAITPASVAPPAPAVTGSYVDAGDVLEVVGLVGEHLLARSTNGQLYALRPVELKVL